MKSVLITGVSTGLGLAAAETLLAAGYRIYGSVRNPADAARLSSHFGSNLVPLLFDVTDERAVRAAAGQVQSELGDTNLAGLVNNAGVAWGGPLMHQPVSEFRALFEVNVFGLLTVTQVFLPFLGARFPQKSPPGRIVNMGSVSGRITNPFMGAYAASKHALEAISDALRRELNIYGIDVILLEPGTIRTPIWDKAAQADPNRYAGTDYQEILVGFQELMLARASNARPAEAIGPLVLHALQSPRPRTRYPVPSKWLTGWLLLRLLPDRWLDRLMVDRVGLTRRR